MRRAGCFAHVGRKFERACQESEQKYQTANEFLLLIGALYTVEADARATELAEEDYYAKRLALRQEGSVATKARLKTRLSEELPKHRPISPLGAAIAYALSQWAGLQVYLQNGSCEIDDNWDENANPLSAVGKRSYLFMGSSDSGHWAATFYSLIGSCLRHKVNPREYLHWVFSKLPTVTVPNAGRFRCLPFPADPVCRHSQSGNFRAQRSGPRNKQTMPKHRMLTKNSSALHYCRRRHVSVL